MSHVPLIMRHVPYLICYFTLPIWIMSAFILFAIWMRDAALLAACWTFAGDLFKTMMMFLNTVGTRSGHMLDTCRTLSRHLLETWGALVVYLLYVVCTFCSRYVDLSYDYCRLAGHLLAACVRVAQKRQHFK